MTAIQIHCEDEALAAELVAHTLAFAQARRLGVEHNCFKGYLVLYRSGVSASKVEPAVVGSSPSNVIAFPTVRLLRWPGPSA